MGPVTLVAMSLFLLGMTINSTGSLTISFLHLLRVVPGYGRLVDENIFTGVIAVYETIVVVNIKLLDGSDQTPASFLWRGRLNWWSCPDGCQQSVLVAASNSVGLPADCTHSQPVVRSAFFTRPNGVSSRPVFTPPTCTVLFFPGDCLTDDINDL